MGLTTPPGNNLLAAETTAVTVVKLWPVLQSLQG